MVRVEKKTAARQEISQSNRKAQKDLVAREEELLKECRRPRTTTFEWDTFPECNGENL
jgi:hypothetical protein